MKQLFIISLFAFIGISAAKAQDTIKVQTFTWADNHRADTFDFPNDPNQSFRKILMKYNMRCHNAAVGNGNVGCYEWDYSCNTFITDPTRVDSSKATAPDYTISNFSGTSFSYSETPTYSYTSFTQHETILTPGINPGEAVYSAQGAIVPYTPAATTYRYQVILQADDLLNAGLDAGTNVYGMRMSLLAPGSTVGFFKIRLKNTDQTIAGDQPDESGLQEVYHRSTDFNANEVELAFYQAFNWTGQNLLVDISFTTDDPTDVPAFEFFESGSDEAAIESNLAQTENSLYFGGTGSLNLQQASYEDIQDEITVSFWSYGDPALLPANTQIFDAADAGGNRQANVHLPWSNGEVYWDCGNDGTGYDRINRPVPVADFEGKWSHWAFTKNATTGVMNIFLNGQLFHSGSGKTKQMNINAFRFGQSLAGSNPYFGSIDEIQIWDKALDENTISAWMSKTVDDTHPDYANLRGYFQLNEGTGNIAHDASPASADASISLPSWKEVRGSQLFFDFSKTNLAPQFTFYYEDYTINDTPVAVLDSTISPLHQVIHYGVDGTNLIRLDTQYLYPAGDRPVYDESGMQIGTIAAPADGVINVQTLNYYSKRPARFEILSLVTPYGNGLDLGPEGKTFVFDVTDFAPILKDRRRMSIEFGGQNQEELDIEFLFIKGTPDREVLDIQPIWPQARGYFNQIQSDQVFEPRQVPLMPFASHFKIRSAITGHEQNGEFVSRQHYININGGAQEFTYDVWKECSRNPIYPQGGTWIFDRAGWCPGMETDVHQFPLDFIASPGQTIEIDYGVNGGNMSSANYLVNNLLVTYGAFNFQVDASIEDILRPNADRVEFARQNPSCNSPTIRVKNSGNQEIESIKIAYRTAAWNEETYVWTGFLEQQEVTDIVLPEPAPGFWLEGSIFTATILEVNGAADGNAENNVYHSNYKPVNVFNFIDQMQLRLATNSPGSDYFYTVKDGSGSVVLLRNNMASNTVYTDDLFFPQGCYTLDFRDNSGDGLSFWFFPENGSGSLRFQRKLPSGTVVPMYSFNPDFGGGVQYDFHIGEMITSSEDVDQSVQLFSTYPNPTMDVLNIDLIGFENHDLRFRLTDMAGKIMMENKFDSLSENETTQIDMSKLAPGIYVLHATDGKRNWVREVVKTN